MLAAGALIDGFRVKRRLAEGAMGEVYLAQDERLGRKVALKFLKATGLAPSTFERFLEEARTTARFAHPHIVTVYAVGTHGNRPYLALEFLDGESLRDRLDRGSLPLPEALRVARAVADALTEAHRHGVIHADLKPENVVLPSDGRPRVVDFGLARLSGSDGVAASGTPAYMAPERWQGAAPSTAIDVWSLGVLLHELIEGERPLSDAELATFAFAPHPPPLGKSVAHHPVGEVLSACLAVDPGARPSAEVVAQRLAALLDGGRHADDARSPFRGLEAFREADAADLSGREDEVAHAAETLRTQGALAVIGPSGIGKSSFVFAGLVPRLREAGRWTVAALRPGPRPLWSLALAVVTCRATRQDSRSSAVPESGSPLAHDVDALAQTLEAEPGALGRALREAAHATQGRVLVFVDQFEELFTLAPPAQADAFARALAAAAGADEPSRLVLALRGDFLGSFAERPALKPMLASVLALTPLGRAALEAAVARPLERVGYRADDPALPARIAGDLDGQPAALPLLQFAGQALWERRDTAKKLVLRAEYDAMGGASGALAAQAQRAIADLSPEQHRAVRALFLRLVNADGTRRPRARVELLSGLGDDAGAVLDRLLERRLLVSGRPDEAGEAMVELAHESLVTTWPALARWLSETQEARQLVADLEAAAALWDKRGRRDEETWAGDALDDAQRRLEKWNVSLPKRAADFVDAGRAHALRRSRRRRAGLVAGVTVLSLLALGASVAALAFREKERQAVAQQEQIRLAAADIGRFELVLEPFDWDPATLKTTPVPASRLPGLAWALYAAARDDDEQVAERLDAPEARFEKQAVDDAGALHVVVEAPSRVTFLALSGRGEAGQACPPAWLRFRRLPGFAEREAKVRIAVPVPTCRATSAGLVSFPAGAFRRPMAARVDDVRVGPFALDATEVPTALFDVYRGLAAWTGDTRNPMPPAMVAGFDPGSLPVTGIPAAVADRFCAFLGKRLPHVDEWQRAAATHPHVRHVPGAVDFVAETTPCEANLAGADDGFTRVAPVGHVAGDVTPEGVHDLLGNVSEWTADTESEESADNQGFAGLRIVLGADWSTPRGAPPTGLMWMNSRPQAHTEYNLGFRCALGEASR